MGKTVVNINRFYSPCGVILIGAVGEELCLCDWLGSKRYECNKRRVEKELDAEYILEPTRFLLDVGQKLNDYFSRRRTTFDIPVRMVGTEFQRNVWQKLLDIPYGEVISYMDIACRLDMAKGVRAVAQAVGANAISIIVPCHRVIGSGGSLVGYAGGLDAKSFLLDLEESR